MPAEIEFPKITVMVPTFNQAHFLEESVASALAQDYPNLEVVVCDDASTDFTPAVLTKLSADPRLKLCRNATNRGRVANYRHLLEDLATGDWVINLDGDDCFANTGYLRSAMEVAREDPDVVMVFAKALSGPDIAHATLVLNDPKQVDQPVPRIMSGDEFFIRFPPFESIGPLHATCLFHRGAARSIGFYRLDILSSDFESFYRLMLGRKIGFVDEVAALWRQHESNATRSRDFEALCANIAVFDGPYRRAVELGQFTPEEAEKWLRRCKSRYVISLMTQVLRKGVSPSGIMSFAAKLVRDDWRLAPEFVPAALRAFQGNRRRRRG